MRRHVAVIFIALLLPTAASPMQLPTTHEPSADPVAQLQQRLDRGEATLEYDAKWGYLPSLLKNLHVPISSQTLVFSKTSLQIDHIAPWSPRALYFNDDVYIGGVQHGPILEISAVDPKAGGVFYTLSQTQDPHPTFERQSTTCLICHNSSSTSGVPGFLVRSVFPDRNGSSISSVGADIATDRTPMKERWGGWFVTGTHSEPETLGNWNSPQEMSEIGNVRSYLSRVNPGTASRKPLAEQFDTTAYLSQHSDIVAVMVLTHQAHLHDLLTLTNQEARKRGFDNTSPDAMRMIVEPLVRSMLFVREAPLAGPMKGSSTFTSDFQSTGPRDHLGRSLRDFDLQHRLFKYPLSYLVYSASFDALPDAARQAIYSRLVEILTNKDESTEFNHLSQADREAILSILSDTKPEFSAYIATVAKNN
jgi:hypothetical protein